MIVSKDINPEKDMYFLGSKIIGYLHEYDEDEVDFIELYSKLNSENKISMSLFSLSLTWLFLLDAIKHSEKGDIIKCF